MPRATAKEHSSYKVGFFFCLWLRPAGLSREVNYPKAYPRQPSFRHTEFSETQGIRRAGAVKDPGSPSRQASCWLLTRIGIVGLARSLMTAAATAVACKLTPVCLAVGLGGGSAVRVSERWSRSNCHGHHHHGRHRKHQDDALHALFPFPTTPT